MNERGPCPKCGSEPAGRYRSHWCCSSFDRGNGSIEEGMPCLRNQIEQLRAENEELRQWQEDARSTDPPRQEIAKELGIPWGASIHDKILPRIRSLKKQVQSWKDAHAVQAFNHAEESKRLLAQVKQLEDRHRAEFDERQRIDKGYRGEIGRLCAQRDAYRRVAADLHVRFEVSGPCPEDVEMEEALRYVDRLAAN